jgi:hypothetical protein
MQIEKIESKYYVAYGYYKGDEFIYHREGVPALEWFDGTKSWFFHGKHHREDGPAIEWANGDKSWWIYGKRHREDGPAITDMNGYKECYLEDKKIEEEDFEEALKIYKVSKVCK